VAELVSSRVISSSVDDLETINALVRVEPRRAVSAGIKAFGLASTTTVSSRSSRSGIGTGCAASSGLLAREASRR
jgi:hypothetical protein